MNSAFFYALTFFLGISGEESSREAVCVRIGLGTEVEKKVGGFIRTGEASKALVISMDVEIYTSVLKK